MKNILFKNRKAGSRATSAPPAQIIGRQKPRFGRLAPVMFLTLLLMTAFAQMASAIATPSFSATWDEVNRRFHLMIGVANSSGSDSWWHKSVFTVDGVDIVTASVSDHKNDDWIRFSVSSNSTKGNVIVFCAHGGDGSILNPTNAIREFNDSNPWAYIDVYYYPDNTLLDRSVSWKIVNSGGEDTFERSGTITVSNPLGGISLINMLYSSYPDFHYDVSYYYNSNYSGVKAYLEYYKLTDNTYSTKLQEQNIALPSSSNGINTGSIVTSGYLTETEITEGRKLRARYEAPPSGYQRMTYTRYSDAVDVQPIKLPTNPKVEDAGCGKLRIKWDVGSGTQSSQAGNVVIYCSTTTTFTTANQIASVAYSTGSAGYEWTIPTSYIGTGNQTYSFRLVRPPFILSSYSSSNVVKSVSFTKNMSYRQTQNVRISPSGTTAFTLSWDNDNGLYCDSYKYRVVVTQGTTTYTSPVIDVTATTASVTVSGAFNLCSPVTIELQMINPANSDAVLVSNTVSSTHVFVTNSGNSTFTSFSASKGFHPGRVQLDWTVSAANEFVKYVIHRKEYGSTAAGDGTRVAVLDHSGGITSYTYEDVNAVPGTYYTYSIAGQLTCGTNLLSTIASAQSIGFIQPYGTVSGRVSFEGGLQAVEGVSVVAEGSGASKNKALVFNGTAGKTVISTPYKTGMLSPTAFTIQCWVNLSEEATATGYYTFMYSAGKYALEIQKFSSTCGVTFYYLGSSSPTFTFPNYNFIQGAYQHLSIAYQASGTTGTAILYVDGVQVGMATQTVTIPTSFTNTSDIYFGKWSTNSDYFNGNIDEMRLWNRTLPATEIAQNYDRYLTGSENGLVLYYRFDELDNLGEVYDLSATGNNFNQNHGKITGTIARTSEEDAIPTAKQLGIKAITDANGNYLINTIPYTGAGNTYNIIPSLGVHQFSPNQKPLFFSSNSTTHNNIDFNDISAFEVSGTVTYEGGTYPVEGCQFEVDDRLVTLANGTPKTSDVNGEFSISVPIGEHRVRVVKTGHTFADDGYLTTPEGGLRSYNDRLTGITFHDQTRVKLIGRIVGGLTESNKPLGFGESVNNTGAATLKLTAAKVQYDLQSTPSSDTVQHNDGQWQKPDGLADDQTRVSYNKKDITISISPATGEYVAWVYPEIYNIGTITAPGYDGEKALYNRNEALDLTSAPVPNDNMLKTSIRTWTDSVTVQRPGELEHKEGVSYSDTVRYHAEWKTYYQATPTFSATQLTNGQTVDYLGETEHIISDALTGETDTVSLWDDVNSYLFGLPVFKQGKVYTLAFNAYEEYENQTTIKAYRYAVNEGVINMTNNTFAMTQQESVELDANGNAQYKFLAGAPDLTTGKHSLFATLRIGAVSYYWAWGDQPIQGWHLGDKSTGTDFMTSGPDEISAILRDPPGSLSYSFIEKGTTITQRSSNSISNGLKESLELTTSLGPKIKTFVGLGAGAIVESEVKMDVSAGINAEEKWTSAEEKSLTTSFTERFQTSADPLYVGSLGDVFIGNSTNIQYGLTNAISIQKNYLDTDTFVTASSYAIAPSVSLAYGQTFDTRFAFTEVELEGIMIPKWRDNLAILLHKAGTQVNPDVISSPVYVSNLAHDHQNFGKLNTDKVAFGASASAADKFHDGPSYTIVFPTAYDMAKFKEDSVMWFNNQINGWTEVLKQNEKEKVEMQRLGNYSFGGGASIEWTKTSTATEERTSTFNFILNPTIGLASGGEVMGIGLELSTTFEYVHEEENTESTATETSISSGFHLEEQGDDDELTVDYGMTASGTVAFMGRGGRTTCPYEGEVKTKYFEPGQHILNEATMQIEVPVIDVEGATQVLNVPANKTAKFVLNLKNESETGEDVWFELIVDEATNPSGAELKIDGGSINNGRTFLVKAGEVLQKTLTVGKGTVDTYDNIGLILRSQCQSDPTDFLPDIADTTYVSVEFVPACSEVILRSPTSNWIVNTSTSDTMNVVLSGFERNFANFGYIKLEYRSTSAATWSNLMNFYANANIYAKASGFKTLLSDADQNISYNWVMTAIPDGALELRATAVCVNVNGEYEIIEILSENTTDAVAGVKDMTRPESMGNPSPVNGIFGASDELSITFNEDIQTGMVTKNSFVITGILNASTIAEPSTGLLFSGATSAHTELPVYASGSFSIETWFKRSNNTAGTLFAYGSGNEIVSLGFDATGHAVVSIGTETKTSNLTVNNTNQTWKYIGLSYNRDAKTVSVFGFQDSDPTIHFFDDVTFTQTPATQGNVYAGAKADGTSGFSGAVAMLHFYDAVQSWSEMSVSKSETKSGTEPNLIGLWEMSEGEGAVATDKARARNLVVNTDWYLYPVGKSLSFNGLSQYATLPSGTFPFRYYDDFTVELQFTAGAQSGAKTLLSIGTSAYIGFDATGKLILTAGGAVQTLHTTSLQDSKWHHIALSVKRSSGGMTTAVVDGVVTASFSSSLFSGTVGGAYYYVGTKHTLPSEYSEYFNGNIDEVRVWKTALNTETIRRNKSHKLRGNEAGLVAYYPFESWTKANDGTYNVLVSNANMADATQVLGGTGISSNTAATVTDAAPETEVTFTYTVSSNKVIFNLTEPMSRTEGVTLNLSAQGLFDLHSNESKPARWIAYVNRSPIGWLTDKVDIVMEHANTQTFNAHISNSGGAAADYYIENLPSWLTVNAPVGQIACYFEG
jgi:hypothetical protein